MLNKSIFFPAIGSVLCACAAAPSNPVAISQPGDASLSCDQIIDQVEANNELAIEKSGADAATVDGNIAKGAIASVIFWPAILAVDLSNSDQIELRALRDRNRSLERLYRKKGCDAG
jgi:hypothetical protein